MAPPRNVYLDRLGTLPYPHPGAMIAQLFGPGLRSNGIGNLLAEQEPKTREEQMTGKQFHDYLVSQLAATSVKLVG